MSTTTKNYELIKPELTDVADITAMNPNWDKLDTELKNLSDHVDDFKDTAGAVELTQEEYDELSQEDKMKDVIYFITNNDDVDDEEKEVEYVGSNPNLLINGDFQVWQRGESFDLKTNGAYKYTADRWCVATSNEYHIEKSENGGITLPCSLYQLLEVPLNKNEDYMLSVCIDDVIYTRSIKGGTSCTSTYLEYVSSSTRDYVRVKFPSTDVAKTIKWVKLEKGAIATPFIPRLYAEELALCMRYYQRVFGVGLAYLFIWPSSYNVALASFTFSPMRATPTVTLHACWGTDSNGNGVTCNSIEVTDVGYDGATMKLTFNSSINNNSSRGCIGQFKLDAEIY